ncbi:MAG: serine/threonine protein kinase [Candidatus Eremiobacteraeota bacterium]|nr:serine/threonine protein kinase [Candidatus Eremiobacteraeota bacterium]
MESERYELGEALGKGAMGEVVKAVDRQLEREVAIKSLRAKHLHNEESKARFVLEAKATGQLQHPNIPTVHELGETEEGRPYFTMTVVQGENLGSIVDRLRQGNPDYHKTYTFARRIQIIQAVCDAIHYAHSRGYLHRDLKPDNIMIGSYGEVQVMDWGLVRRFSEDPGPRLEKTTVKGTFIGTAAYAAPEQIAGESEVLDERTDVYGLGALLYELTTLHPPHTGRSVREVMMSVVTKSPPKPESYRQPLQGRVPRELSRLIQEAMAPLPDERLKSALELKQRLQIILEGEAAPVCPHTHLKRNAARLQKFLDNHNSPLTVVMAYLWLLSPPLLLAGLLYSVFK